MKVNKFVLIDRGNDTTEIRFGCVEMHSDLVSGNEKCTGGGMYAVRKDRKQILLYDKSYDYGYPHFGGRTVIDREAFDDLEAEWSGYKFYNLPDIFMPADEDYEVKIAFADL